MSAAGVHLDVVRDLWSRIQERKDTPDFEFDGSSLHIGDVAAVAYHGGNPSLSKNEEVSERLEKSVKVLMTHLENGYYIYGVNTGFGGSADTRTEEVVGLQAALMQLTQAGILSKTTDGFMPDHSMPTAWSRAIMIVRCNATARGHSAVSINILQTIVSLMQTGLSPVIPLRGSVSASGDLIPLAYIAGAVEGNPDVLIQMRNGQVLPAPEALKAAGVPPRALGPKEGLGLVNGTAASAAVGALAMEKSHSLALLTQVLTGVSVEALGGSVESFDPFIAEVRPHAGQIECARNIALFLKGSRLARGAHAPADRRGGDLIQDRYSLRSAPQWIGPQLEDLLLADRQVTTELNSSCDNPLTNTETGDILYGCNFQASSVTAAMEKARLSLQMFGRLLFSQTTEMMDPGLSGGLPANLAADDPSLSFALKGVDISMASYMAELSYYANPMSSHVQAAEMHNQSINSMALASARMTFEAINLLTMMCACTMYAGCQALDLRVLHTTFLNKALVHVIQHTRDVFAASLSADALKTVEKKLRAHCTETWKATGKKDLRERCEHMVSSSLPILLDHVPAEAMSQLGGWKSHLSDLCHGTWKQTFDAFCQAPTTADDLGAGSKALYQFVRRDLRVPFHRGFVEHPKIGDDELDGRPKKTVGGWISVIHDQIANGNVYGPLANLIEEYPAGRAAAASTNGVKVALNGAKH